ncbi:hypothetical protein Ddye_020698 [Dipteronia dyeriana]|uniref:Uncharacterized protein n=1 Tax=Dipteronia dyeriana TaxID=168575 RepID=A0AAD9U113_9ROSI|nr:hypothetical protein Ddye_020698 [Dipteronia dyeriana]
MKDPAGNWIAEPPSSEPIVAEDKTVHNLNEYIEIRAEDISTNVGAELINGVSNKKLGVELSLVSGKAAWMAYLDIYCLDADGALFDAAFLSAVAAFPHLQIPVVSLGFDGKIVIMSEEQREENSETKPVNNEKRKLTLSTIPFSLTCILHKSYILADLTAEEESIMETLDCVALTRQRVKELQNILDDAISGMEID